MTLIELAERCERAEGPDRKLDGDIYQAVTGECPHRHLMTVEGDADCLMEVCSDCCEEEPYRFAPTYTASIDAALTLLPVAEAGYSAVFWRLGNDGEGGNPEDFKAEVLNCAMLTSQRFLAVAVTPALALCAAALRSRAATEGQTDG